MGSPGNPFGSGLFRFLKDLKANNDREWFQKNKARYEDELKEPALEFISLFGPRLRKISPHFRAIPKATGGSLFRIYRDTRFSKDKTPYKTHLGIHFRHKQAKSVHTPGFYLHIEPGEAFVGLGIWHPESPALRSIREAIVDDPAAWKRAKNAKRFREVFELSGDSLTRPPRGFDPEHPLIEDIKRKDFIGVTRLTQKQALAPDFLDTFSETCRAGAPLVRWLCGALDVPF